LVELVLSFLSVVAVALAASLTLAARFFIRREREWNERHWELVNRLLKQAHVPPLTVERERVVKLPDPEIQPASFIDDAFFVDDVKEELEQIYPEVARMTHAEAQARYAKEWESIAQKLRKQQTPLRAQ
jgi:hypothetical protein